MLTIQNTSAYGFGVTSHLPFPVALELAKEAFEAEGFKVVSQIEMREVFCEELGAAIAPYTVLGLCNAATAYRILREETEAGLLMPCNVLVRSDRSSVHVSVMNPHLLIRVTENNRLRGLSDGLYAGLERGLNRFLKLTAEPAQAA
jgi:uncharacterized protein (DUF302 family)